MNGSRRTPPEVFERAYRDTGDPWDYETSAYERAKYERTLAVLGDRRYARALEVGCSIGVFTERLASRCDELVALDPSPTALSRARERLSGQRHVRFEQAAVPEGLPAGTYDLVVCSEVLCYLGEPLLIETLRKIENRLRRGGTLIAVHWCGSTSRSLLLAIRAHLNRSPRGVATPGSIGPGADESLAALSPALSGDGVHALLRAHTRLALTHEERTLDYRLDRFDASARAGGRLKSSRARA